MIIKGYKGTVSIEDAKKLSSKGVFVFNAMCVGGKEHIIYAYQKARESFRNGTSLSRSLHIEIMLYLTGKRQIREALSLCSVADAENIAAISEHDFELSLRRDDSVLDCSEAKLNFLGISINPEVVDGKICDLFLENSAMLELEK